MFNMTMEVVSGNKVNIKTLCPKCGKPQVKPHLLGGIPANHTNTKCGFCAAKFPQTSFMILNTQVATIHRLAYHTGR